MNLVSLFMYTVFLMCLWMIFFVLSKNLKTRAKLVCIVLISSIAFWDLGFTFIQVSASHDIALFWLDIASIGWCSIAIAAFWVSLVLINRKILNKWYFYLFIFLVPAVFIYKQLTGYLVDVVRQPYGWSIIWSKSIWPWLFYIYCFSVLVVIGNNSYYTIKRIKLSIEKRRIKFLNLSAFIFFITEAIMDVVLPQLNINIIPSFGPVLAFALASTIVYGVTKYRLMTLTPAYAASDILATMSDSLILISPEGNVIEVNNATLTLLDYTKEEITGSPAKKLFKDNTTQFLDEEEAPLLKEESFGKHQIYLHTKNGEDIPVSFSVSKMKDKEGNLLGFVGVARDMRELLRLQESEREFTIEKTRSDALMERAQELQEAYDKLKAAQAMLLQSEKMAAVGQLAGGVAHEINNPMGVILGFSQSIVKRIKEDDPLYMPLKSIEREAMRCKKLVGGFIDLFKNWKNPV